MTDDEQLARIREAYAEAARTMPEWHEPLPKWEDLAPVVREAIIHVWHDGRRLGAEEERKR
jgi:hypothetical protein